MLDAVLQHDHHRVGSGQGLQPLAGPVGLMGLDRQQYPVGGPLHHRGIGENGRVDEDGFLAVPVNRDPAEPVAGAQDHVLVASLLDSGGKDSSNRAWTDHGYAGT